MRSCARVVREVVCVGVCRVWPAASECRDVAKCLRPAQAVSWWNATGGSDEETKKSGHCREQLKAAGVTMSWRLTRAEQHLNLVGDVVAPTHYSTAHVVFTT